MKSFEVSEKDTPVSDLFPSLVSTLYLNEQLR